MIVSPAVRAYVARLQMDTLVDDPDWESNGGHYRVRIESEWVDVLDDAVITVPNKVGRKMVWPMRDSKGLKIRCFMPGSMT